MIATEFAEWLEYHTGIMPSVDAYLSKLPDREILLDEWASILEDVPLANAKAVSRKILAGDVEKPFPDDIPACVRANASFMSLDEPSRGAEPGDHHTCGLCKSTGLVSIWHPLVVRSIREGVDAWRDRRTGAMVRCVSSNGDVKPMEAAVACECERGNRRAYWSRQAGKGVESIYLGRWGDSVNYIPKRVRLKVVSTWRQHIEEDIDAFVPRVTEWSF